MDSTISRLSETPPASIRPEAPIFSADGTDLTLIRWMLSLTPRERLLALQQTVRSIERLRHARTRTHD